MLPQASVSMSTEGRVPALAGEVPTLAGVPTWAGWGGGVPTLAGAA